MSRGVNPDTIKQSITAALIAALVLIIGAFFLLYPAWSSARDAERRITAAQVQAERDANPLRAVPARESATDTEATIRSLAPDTVAVIKVTARPTRPSGILNRSDYVVRVKGQHAVDVGRFIEALNDAIVMEAGVPRGAPNARLLSVVGSDITVGGNDTTGTITVRAYSRRAADAPTSAPG